MSDDRRPLLVVLLGSASLVTGILHLSFVPRYLPDDVLLTVLTLGAGWATYTLVFYALARVVASPAGQGFPSMRAADLGIAVLLVSLLVLLTFDSVGIPFSGIGGVYTVPALGIYVGLALIGWSIGRRTEAINEMAR